MSFLHGLGKGLREPCSPNRATNVFGAELNSPNADNWNCLPAVVNPTTSFNLSLISPGQEVVVALLGVYGAVEGAYHVTYRWYRDRDNKLLFQYAFDWVAPRGGWFYCYSFIGYVPWEISENGAYSVDISVTGAETFSRSTSFTISGIAAAEPEPPPASVTGADIVTALNSCSSWFYKIYLECLSAGAPLWWIASFLYQISLLFNTLANGASSFFTSFNELWARAANILSWDTIWSYLLSYIPNIAQIRDWFYSWWDNVGSVISSWWAATTVTVQGWISIARAELRGIINQVDVTLGSLRADWDAFRGMIPTIEQVIYWWGNWAGNVNTVLTTWWAGQLLEIQGLINSAFTARQSLWAGWQEMRDNVAGFFDDPVEYIWDRFIDWFLGPEV